MYAMLCTITRKSAPQYKVKVRIIIGQLIVVSLFTYRFQFIEVLLHVHVANIDGALSTPSLSFSPTLCTECNPDCGACRSRDDPAVCRILHQNLDLFGV